MQPSRSFQIHPVLLLTVDLLCAPMPQALEKADCQPAWRVRHLLSLALCQGSEEGKPDDVPKTLAKALELATSANLQQLRVSHGRCLDRQAGVWHLLGLVCTRCTHHVHTASPGMFL
jgi:hypothetical protein